MLDFLLSALATSLFCCGLHFITRDGWVLSSFDDLVIWILGGRVTYRFDAHVMDNVKDHNLGWGENIYKPVLGCVVCMGSFWGVIGGLICGVSIISLVPFCLIVAALNGVIYFNLLKHFE